MAYEQRVNRYGTWIDNSDDYFDLAPLSNMNVEMTDQTCQREMMMEVIMIKKMKKRNNMYKLSQPIHSLKIDDDVVTDFSLGFLLNSYILF
jgi:hypothetical protein